MPHIKKCLIIGGLIVLLYLSLVSCGVIKPQETDSESTSQPVIETESDSVSIAGTESVMQTETQETETETEEETEWWQDPNITVDWTPLLFYTIEEYDAWLAEATDLPSNFITFDQISWLGEFMMFSEEGGPYGYSHQAYRYSATSYDHTLDFALPEHDPILTTYEALTDITGDLRTASTKHARAYHELGDTIYLYNGGMLESIYVSMDHRYLEICSGVVDELHLYGFSDYPITEENADSIIARLLHSDTAEGAVAEIIQGLTKENP